MKWIWKAHRKKVCIGFTQFVQYRPKMTGFIIICEGLSLAKCEKKDVRESYSQNITFFNHVKPSSRKEDNIPIN